MKTSYDKVLMLCLRDFDVLPCNPFLSHILTKYEDFEFNIYDVINYFNCDSSHISWLLIHCPKSRTDDMFALYLSMNPSVNELLYLITFYLFARRIDVLEHILSLKPTSEQLCYLLHYRLSVYSEKVLQAFLSNNPSSTLISSLISRRKFAQREDVWQAYLLTNPSDDDKNELANRCDYVKQKLHCNL